MYLHTHEHAHTTIPDDRQKEKFLFHFAHTRYEAKTPIITFFIDRAIILILRVEFGARFVSVAGKQIKLQIWDTVCSQMISFLRLVDVSPSVQLSLQMNLCFSIIGLFFFLSSFSTVVL